MARNHGRNIKGRRVRNEPHVVAEEAVRYGLSIPEKQAPGDQFISPNAAARILNITGEAVKQWIYHRRLPAVKLSNGYWKVRVSDLEAYIKARHNITSRRIMIFDRPGSDSKGLSDTVEALGHEPVVAHNMGDAMLKAVDLLPALFIINISLSPTDAWKLVERIRKTRNIRRLPVVIIADSDLKEPESQRAVDLDVQGFLCRPIKSAALAGEIKRILNRIL